MIRLRAMVEGDLEWVLKLDQETEAAARWSLETYREYLGQAEATGALRRFAMVAELDGERAGMALGRLLLDGVENACELEWISVEPTLRRRGVGRALMKAVEAWTWERGGLRMLLEVRSGNDSGQRLYGEYGWMEIGRRRGYYRDPVEDAVLMERVSGGGGKVEQESD